MYQLCSSYNNYETNTTRFVFIVVEVCSSSFCKSFQQYLMAEILCYVYGLINFDEFHLIVNYTLISTFPPSFSLVLPLICPPIKYFSFHLHSVWLNGVGYCFRGCNNYRIFGVV